MPNGRVIDTLTPEGRIRCGMPFRNDLDRGLAAERERLVADLLKCVSATSCVRLAKGGKVPAGLKWDADGLRSALTTLAQAPSPTEKP
jgi:hypothetical protein